MLRNIVGDEAFFASIKHYLEKHKFNAVEIHDLRIAFEETTGTDLNWFFNQWFLESGHPKLNLNYTYNDTIKKQIVYIEQTPSNDNGIIYRLPIRIDVYNKAKIDTHYVVISQQKDTFYFEANYKPEFVNVDAEKILVCDKIDNKSITEWISQFMRCTKYLDKLEALQFLENKFNDTDVPELFAKALLDKNWHIRNYATNIVKEHAKENSSLFKNTLIKLSQKDEKSLVRASAIDALSHSFDDRDLMNIYKRAIDDASYTVESEALQAIFKADKELGIEFARTFETDSIAAIIATLCNIYSLEGEERDNEYFLKAENWLSGSEKYNFCKSYSTFLLNKSDSTINKSLPLFEKIASSENAWYVRLSGFNALDLLKDLYLTKKKETIENIKNLQAKKVKENEIISNQKQLEFNETQYAHISSIIRSIKSKETNKNLVEIYGKLN
jgi:aminopeptidase N